MLNKVQDLIREGRVNDAIALAKIKSIKKLEEGFVRDFIFSSPKRDGESDRELLTLYERMLIAETFGIKLPEEVVQREYDKLLDDPKTWRSDRYSALADLMKKTRIKPRRKSVLARYEQEFLRGDYYDLESVKGLVKKTRIPFEVSEEVIQKGFEYAVRSGDYNNLLIRERLLGRVFDFKKVTCWDVKVAVQEACLSAFKGMNFSLINLLLKKTGVSFDQKVIDESYDKVICICLNHIECCQSLKGSDGPKEFLENFKPRKFPARMEYIVKELFLGEKAINFSPEDFKACFPGFKLKATSELGKKINENCLKLVESFGHSRKHPIEITNYLAIVSECLGFQPRIPKKVLMNSRRYLEQNEMYEALEQFFKVFPQVR